jgi:hypothetical protein
LAKNTKTKVRTTLKKYGVDLSSEVELPSIESFETRDQFNEWKNKQSSFTNKANTRYQFKKNDYGVVASKFEINNIVKDVKTAQRIADKKIKESKNKPIISGGKIQGTQGQKLLGMATKTVGGITRPKDFNFGGVKNQSRFNEIKENAKKRADPDFVDKRAERMRDTYIQELEKAFNSDADDVIKNFKLMPVEDFLELYNMNVDFQFDLFYRMKYLDTNEKDDVLVKLESVVSKYYDDELNPLFKLRNK